MTKLTTTRREVLAMVSALGVSGLAPARSLAQEKMPMRKIPSSGEMLPVIGLGSSKVVEEIAKNGEEPVAGVLKMLVAQGGKLVDTWPRNAANDAGFGRVINRPELRDRLFITTKIDQMGKQAGIAQFRQAQQNYQKKTIDLAQIFSMIDVDTHWPSLKDWKQSGEARYIGVTVSTYDLYPRLQAFLQREKPDFVQMNYSITERGCEDRMLPMAVDKGVGVIINRPFMNGAYFRKLEGQPLPEWTKEFGCESWAQFSLKYILANPGFTVVLTETSNPAHMEENAHASFGQMPNEAARAKMRAYIDQVSA
jgi:diketogulonate reductase-like aldo/keto reductase